MKYIKRFITSFRETLENSEFIKSMAKGMIGENVVIANGGEVRMEKLLQS